MEDCCLPILIGDSVALEDDPPLKLAFGVARGKLGILLDTNTEEVPEVDFLSSSSGLIGNVVPFTNDCFIPNILGPQTIPFCIHGRFCGRSGRDFGSTNRPSNASVKEWASSIYFMSVFK